MFVYWQVHVIVAESINKFADKKLDVEFAKHNLRTVSQSSLHVTEPHLIPGFVNNTADFVYDAQNISLILSED